MNSIFIPVPNYNRGHVAKVCLSQLINTRDSNSHIRVYDDGTTEYDPSTFLAGAYDTISISNHIGIDKQRINHLDQFIKSEMDFCYFTDSDAYHDPNWIIRALELYNQYKLPVSLFNSEHHAKNEIEQLNLGAAVRKSVPGISLFIDRKHAEIISRAIKTLGESYIYSKGWDWSFGEFLTGKVVTSLTSFVEHYGANGIHNSGFFEDTAINPTEFLRLKRPELLDYFVKNFKKSDSPIISLCHATRGRPSECIKARDLWLSRSSKTINIEHIFGVDSDDVNTISAVQGFNYVVVSPGSCVRAWNACAAKSKGKILIQMSDDWDPPKDWDSLIVSKLGDLNKASVLAVSDGFRTDQLLCMAILTRARYLQQGSEMFSSEYESVYSDDEFTLRAYRDRLVIEARDLVFKHLHPFHLGGNLDETYKASNSSIRYVKGLETFKRRNPETPKLLPPPPRNFQTVYLRPTRVTKVESNQQLAVSPIEKATKKVFHTRVANFVTQPWKDPRNF